MTLLSVEGIAKRYGALAAVDGMSFAIASGEVVALIGPNGAGKSTLFDCIAGRRSPDAGSVTLGGRRIEGRGPRAARAAGLGRTFQITAAFTSMTAAEGVQTAIAVARGRHWAVRPIARRLFRAEALALLDRVGIAARADAHAATLPYGDLKRLELAIALAGEPRLLMLDEPTAGMPSGERARLMDLVAGMVAGAGLTVLFTEHDIDTVFARAGRVLVMDRGRLIADGAPSDVRANRQVRAVYLGDDAA